MNTGVKKYYIIFKYLQEMFNCSFKVTYNIYIYENKNENIIFIQIYLANDSPQIL